MRSPDLAESRSVAVRWTNSIRLGGLLLLAAAAPFEQIDPPSFLIFRVSSVEILILFVLACVLLGFILNGSSWRFRSKVTWPAVLLAGAFVLASLFAPLKGEALRQSARVAVGVILFIVAFNDLKESSRQRRFVFAVFLGGIVVACLGVLEFFGIGFVDSLLGPFKKAPFQVGGWIRASSTLQYPTIAAMYLEMVFALGIGLLIDLVSRKRHVSSVLTFLALMIVAEGLLGTLTRSGLVLLFLLAAGGLIYIWTKQGFSRPFAWLGAVLCMVGLLAFVNLGASPGLTMRLKDSDQRQWYRARLTVLSQPGFRTNGEATVEVLAENRGVATWDSNEGFYVSYHWMAPNEDVVEQLDGLRTSFPGPVAPGESVRLPVHVRAPSEPGQYRLAFDVLKEHQFWFSAMGSELPTRLVTVAGDGAAASHVEKTSLPDPIFKVSRISLWKVASRIILSHPILGIGPGNFQHVYGQYLGFERWDEHTHTNSLYFEILVSMGIVGAVPFALFVWSCLSLCFDLLLPGRKSGDGLSLGVSLAVLAFLVHGLVDYFLPFTPTYVIFWLTLGLLAACAQGESNANANRI